MSEDRWELPPTWAWASMGQIAEVIGGGTPSASDPSNFSDNGVPWLTPADLTGYRSTYISRGRRDLSESGYKNSAARILPKGSVLYTSRAPIGYCAIAAGEISTNQGFKSFILRGCISPEYLRHYLIASVDYAESKASGTTFTELSGSRAAELAAPIPPLPEQRRIVAKIDSLSAKSARARDHLDHIPRLVAKYKQAILAAAFQSSTLGPRVRLQPLSEIVTSGSRGWKRYYSNDGSLFLRVGNVRRGLISLDLSDVQRVSPAAGSEGERTQVRENDIVVTITADLGRIGLIPTNLDKAYVNQHVALVRLRDPSNASFVAWFLTSAEGQQKLFEKNRGMTKAGLGLDDIRAVTLPLPNLEIQQAIVRRIETAFAWIDRLAAEATSARKLVDRLDAAVLAKAFRGELVPQDPADEPASVLLDRIRAERVATPPKRRNRSAARLKKVPSD